MGWWGTEMGRGRIRRWVGGEEFTGFVFVCFLAGGGRSCVAVGVFFPPLPLKHWRSEFWGASIAGGKVWRYGVWDWGGIRIEVRRCLFFLPINDGGEGQVRLIVLI